MNTVNSGTVQIGCQRRFRGKKASTYFWYASVFQLNAALPETLLSNPHLIREN